MTLDWSGELSTEETLSERSIPLRSLRQSECSWCLRDCYPVLSRPYSLYLLSVASEELPSHDKVRHRHIESLHALSLRRLRTRPSIAALRLTCPRMLRQTRR